MVDELELLKRFRAFLRSDDKEVFDDLLNECRLDGSYAGTMASPVKEVPLLMCMLFGQHKRIMELEKKVNVQRRGECQHTVTKTEVKKAAALRREPSRTLSSLSSTNCALIPRLSVQGFDSSMSIPSRLRKSVATVLSSLNMAPSMRISFSSTLSQDAIRVFNLGRFTRSGSLRIA